jgi:hypothetical protein
MRASSATISARIGDAARDQRLDQAVLGREVMQQTALAAARLGRDRIERQVADALAHDHRLRGVQQLVAEHGAVS